MQQDGWHSRVFFSAMIRTNTRPRTICLDNIRPSRPDFKGFFVILMSTTFCYRIMTNGSLPRDKTKFLFETMPDCSDPPRVVQSPRTKIKTTCSYTVNRVSSFLCKFLSVWLLLCVNLRPQNSMSFEACTFIF